MAIAVDEVGVPRTTTFIGSVNLVAQIADKLLSFGQIILVAAVLGSSASGDEFFLASIVPLTIGFVVGEPAGRALVTLLVRGPSLDAGRSIAASGLLLTVGTLVALTLAYDAVAVVLVRIFTPAASGDVWPWLAFSLIAPAMGIGGVLSGLLIWLHRYGWAAARIPLASVLGLALLSLAIVFSNRLLWIALALSGGYVLTALLLYLRVTALLGRRWISSADRASFRTAAGAGRMLIGPAAGGAIGGQVIVTLERILAGTIGTGNVASISYARGMATAPTVLAQAVGASSYPSLVRSEAAGDVGFLRESLTRGLRLGLYVGLTTAAFLVLYGPAAVDAILQRGNFAPHAADQTSHVLVSFAASTLTGSLLVYLVSVIYGLGRFSAILWLELAVFATYLVAALILRATNGLTGLAVAFAIAQAAGVIVAAGVCMKVTGLSITTVLRRVILPVLPLAAIVVSVIALYRLATSGLVVPVGIRGIVRVGGGGLCLLITGTAVLLLSPLPEAAQLRQFLRRR
jgi:peptidoglycan biosynthesis protein MviN/MurJ (putative lipid II flippase)